MFGKCGNMLRGYCTTCTNRTEENKNQQLYVKRCYALKNLIISAFVHSSILCLIFKQYIACIVLFAMTFVSWGIIELVLAKCTKYQLAKAEISDEMNEVNRTEVERTMQESGQVLGSLGLQG